MDMELEHDGGRRDGMELLNQEDMEDGIDGASSSLDSGSSLQSVISGFALLGFRCFGGTSAQTALLHEQFVEKRRWLDEGRFRELMGLGHGMPGPTTIQMVIALGAMRAGPVGGAVAFLLFNGPGLVMMLAAGLAVWFLSKGDSTKPLPDWYYEVIVGLPAASVAHVVYSAFRLSYRFCQDGLRTAMATVSTLAVLLVTPGTAPWVFPLLIILGGLFTFCDARFNPDLPDDRYPQTREGRAGSSTTSEGMFAAAGISWPTSSILLLAVVGAFFLFLIVRSLGVDHGAFAVLSTIYRITSIAYGGEHVILPMLKAEVLDAGWIPASTFFCGLSLTQILPGHLFNLPVFLGAAYLGLSGAFLAIIGVCAAPLMLAIAFLSFWDGARNSQLVLATLVGINGVATGVVVAAAGLLFITAVQTTGPLCVVVAAGSAVALFRWPLPFAVITGGLLGWILFRGDVGGPYCWVPSYTQHFPEYEAYCTHWHELQSGL